MKINMVNSYNKSFGALTPKDFINMNLEIALSKSVIFPNAIEKSANKMGKKYPKLINSEILKSHNSVKALAPILKKDGKELSLLQRVWTYLFVVPREIKRSYMKLR